MDVHVLGPLRVRTARGPVEISGVKERTVLARLVAAGGRTVTVDDLADTLWGDDPPRSAAKSVQNYVLRLRKALEPERDGTPRLLLTDGAGYRLDLPDDAVDALRFERLVELGRRAAAEGRAGPAAATLAEALALWQGRAYEGFEAARFAAMERLRLEETRLAALEDRLSADLELGRARTCIPELEALVLEHPLRERFWELLVLALYRAGRQADALSAYARARSELVAELGVEPGTSLRALHARVLTQDVGLAPPVPAPRLPPALAPQPGELVGRETELAVLREAWQRAEREPVTVVVRGAPGTGARRLVGELATEVAAAGFEVLADDAPPTRDARVLRVVHAEWAGGVETRTAAAAPSRTGLTIVLARPGSAVPRTATLLDLRPLPPRDVQAILETYLDPDTARSVLPDVLRRSGGRPGTVHDLAVQHARQRASSRVGSAATAAAAGQRTLDDARAALREGLTDLDDVLDRARRTPADVPPWKGLAAYDVDDAPLFAGRERLVAELEARLVTSPVLGVVGSSGSGKSSLVRAGLVAGLRAGVLPGSEAWTVLLMRPGAHPLRELACVALQGREPAQDQVAELLRRMVLDDDAGSRLVLVVDQAEELFTACDDADERDAFLDTVLGLAHGDRRASLVLVVRSDYAGELADRPELAAALSGATVLVGAPTEAEVRRAVEQPAGRCGLVLDVGLTDALVADAGDRPGVLPLLSTALAELWEHRSGHRLTLAAYAAAGGVSGAVARLAERTYDSLDDDGRAAVRVLLLRLAGSGENQSVVRRRVPLAELQALPDRRVLEVVAPLADARLVTLDQAHVEVAHEALFAQWPRLRGWLEEDAASRGVRTRLASAAVEWHENGRDPVDLWRGARLAAATDLQSAHPEELTALETEFVEAGRDALDAEQQAAERRARDAHRQNRRLRWLLGGLGVLLAVALGSGLLALQAGDRAARQAVVAQVRELAAASAASVGTDPELSVLLALEAVDLTRAQDGTVLPEASEALHRAVTSSRVVLTADGIGGRVDWSPDGRLFVTEGPEESGLVDLRDARTGQSVRSFRADDVDLNMARFNADGSMLASAGDDGTLRIWNPRDGVLLHELPGSGSIWSPAFSADGATVAAAWLTDSGPVARVWDLRDGTLQHERPLGGVRWAFAMSGDGRRLAAPIRDDTVVVVWDVATGRDLLTLEGHDAAVTDIDFSPDGRWISTAGADHTARLWDAATGLPAHTLTGHRATVAATAWSADSRQLATGGPEGLARVWRVEDDAVTPLMSLVGAGTQNVYDVAFSPDGRRLLVGDEGVTAATVFDVSIAGDAEVLNVPGNPEGAFAGASFTPDGQLLASSAEGGVTRWRLDDAEPTSRMPRDPAGPEHVRVLSASPDGTLVAGMSWSESASVWHVDRGRLAFTARPGGSVEAAAWSPDGAHVALSGSDGITLLDREGRTVRRMTVPRDVDLSDAAFSPDGRTVAAVAWPSDRPQPHAYEVVVWDAATGERTGEFTAPAATRIAYSPDGNLLAVGSLTGPASVVDADTGTVVARLQGHSAYVSDVAFSPDGTRAATSSTDGTARLWDARTGVSLLTLHGHRGAVVSVEFSPDGRRLVTAGADGLVRVWTLDVEELLTIARQQVTRSLTDAECRQYLHRPRCEDGT